ncbi:MAG: helix-turn-helix domain-containing protein [Deltaproteobacteria bacterium]|nr:helix-turn-helix domain-containing protein [Deltaproteobacteria bacterium]
MQPSRQSPRNPENPWSKARNHPIGELTEEFGVTRRTLYRDLKALEEAGYPILSEVIDGTTYWKLEAIPAHQVRT